MIIRYFKIQFYFSPFQKFFLYFSLISFNTFQKKEYCILQSETYEVFDTLYHDEMTSDTTSRYGVYSTMSLAFDEDKLTVTRISDGGGYADYGVNGAGCDIYKGKTIKFECDIVNATDTVNLAVYSDGVNNQSSSTTQGQLSTTIEIPSNATYIRFRIVTNNLGTNGTCSFRNIKIYPV